MEPGLVGCLGGPRTFRQSHWHSFDGVANAACSALHADLMCGAYCNLCTAGDQEVPQHDESLSTSGQLLLAGKFPVPVPQAWFRRPVLRSRTATLYSSPFSSPSLRPVLQARFSCTPVVADLWQFSEVKKLPQLSNYEFLVATTQQLQILGCHKSATKNGDYQ